MDTKQGFTHFNEEGRARMVDVSDKAETKRQAVAQAIVEMAPDTLAAILEGTISKGDVMAVAQVAGVMAAKKTSDLIPMCHPLPLTGVDIRFRHEDGSRLYIEATVSTTGKTGVEMEALTSVATAALTVYDMCKSLQKDMLIKEISLLRKTGGKSGDYNREA